jgi:type IV secretion system protein VirD4
VLIAPDYVIIFSIHQNGKERGSVGLLRRFGAWLDSLFEAAPERPLDRGADWASFEEIRDAGLVGERGIPLGEASQILEQSLKWHPLRYPGENHLITIGKPGSGKGTTTIVPALLQFPGSCIVIDPKGQNAAITARARGLLGDNHKVFILNPFNVLSGEDVPDQTNLNKKGEHVKNCAGFNPLDRIDTASDNFVADVRSLAQALIITQGKDTHWPDAAREMVSAIIMYVCLTCSEDKRNLGQVRALLSLPIEAEEEEDDTEESKEDAATEEQPSENDTEKPKEDAATEESSEDDGDPKDLPALMLAMSQYLSFPPLAQKAAQFTDATTEIKSIISTARTQLAFLDDPAICKCLAKSDFRFNELKCAKIKITVYLVLPFKQMEAQGRWLRLLITAAIEELTDEPRRGDGRVLFMLDEFAQLGRLMAIERALALVRGYGVQLWPFVQDLPQLKNVYPDRWESFLSSSGVAQFFTPNDEMTAKYISERCGQRLISRKSVSQSTSTGQQTSQTAGESLSEHWEALFTPWSLYGHKLKGDQQMLFVERVSPVVFAFRTDYFLDKAIAHLADPDPFHL